MTKEQYFNVSEEIKSIPISRENWYITFPPPDKLKNFESLNCRMVFFIVTDIPIAKSENYFNSVMKGSFNYIKDLSFIDNFLHSNPNVNRDINFLDFQISNSLNKMTKEKVLSFTIHYVDRVSEALKLLYE